MKKVICVTTSLSEDEKVYVIKDRIYTVVEEVVMRGHGKPGYILEELPGYEAVQSLFRDIESPPVLVTFTKITEQFPVHAN